MSQVEKQRHKAQGMDADLCAVIQACKQAGVKEIKWKGVEIKFGGLEIWPDEELQNLPVASDGTSADSKLTDATKQAQQEVDKEMLIVTDPYAWEQGEVTDGRD
jgi:hypothetical protein